MAFLLLDCKVGMVLWMCKLRNILLRFDMYKTLVWPSCHQLLRSDKAWFKGWIAFRTLVRGTDLNYHKAYSLKCLPPCQFETVWMNSGIPGGFACLWRQDMSLRSHRNPWPAYNLPSLCTHAFLCCFPFICKGILCICWLPQSFP